MQLTRFCHVKATLVLNMRLIRKPLHTLSQGIHVRVLEYVYCHYDLIIPGGVVEPLSRGVGHSVGDLQKMGDSLTS